jgi:hypothetical protein
MTHCKDPNWINQQYRCVQPGLCPDPVHGSVGNRLVDSSPVQPPNPAHCILTSRGGGIYRCPADRQTVYGLDATLTTTTRTFQLRNQPRAERLGTLERCGLSSPLQIRPQDIGAHRSRAITDLGLHGTVEWFHGAHLQLLYYTKPPLGAPSDRSPFSRSQFQLRGRPCAKKALESAEGNTIIRCHPARRRQGRLHLVDRRPARVTLIL